jgi:acetyl-CoA acetyltransferase
MATGYHGHVAIASAAMTDLSTNSGRTVLDLATQACREALTAAGLPVAEVDGIASFSIYGDSVPSESVAGALGIRDLSYVMDFNQGGQSAAAIVMNAAMAIYSGQASAVLAFRALNGRSGVRIGREPAAGDGTALRYPVGLIAYPQVQALSARRYMEETGATERDLAAAAINARRRALLNPRALRKSPLTEESYFESPYIAEPFRRVDCTVEVDGACAVLVTSLEMARGLRLTPAVIRSSGWHTHSFDLDMASLLTYESGARNYGHYLKDRLFGEAGMTADDIDVFCLYDCFTGVLLQNIEGFGLCPPGGAGELIRRQMEDSSRPVINPSGGLLAEGYLHGMNHIAESVWQLQGVAGASQVPGCNTVMTCSGGAMCGSALILERDSGR